MGHAVISKADIDTLLKLLPSEEARRTLSLVDALKVFDRSADKKRCAVEIAARLEPLGYKGLSLKSLYRKLDQFRAVGVWACVDRRVARRVTAQGLAANRALVEEWHARVLSNRRKIKPAWCELLADLAGGVAVPGVGTWRDLYQSVYGYRPAEGEPCPWSVRNPPPGWSLRNLMQIKPDKFALAAARVGMGAAKIDFLPTVRLTRVGLLPCQVVEVDDMWYEHMVVFGGNAKPQRVVEFAIYDRLTGYVICHLSKPIVKGWDDETRKTLKSVWVNYLYQYLFCVVGLPRGVRVVIKGEHGTASLDKRTAAIIADINAVRGENEKIEFRAGSIITEPLAKGLPDVQHHGNPRHKGSLEGLHGTLKNIVDSLCFGNIGGGRGKQPEDADTMREEDAALMKIAEALPAAASANLRYHFPTWGQFIRVIDRAYEILNGRTDHQLEGWEECGFMVGELKVAGMPHWTAIPRMAALPSERAAQVRALLASGVAEYRERRMSPAEAWATATRDHALETVSPGFAPMILGKELAHPGVVGDKLTVTVRDAETGERYVVSAVIDGRPLARGAKVQVWVNPMDSGKAYVADEQGRFLGVASTLQAVRADAAADVPELQRQLSMRSAALAEVRRRLAPVVRRRLAARNAAAAHNLAALGMEDPVAEAAERDAADRVLSGISPDGRAALGPSETSDRDLLPPGPARGGAPDVGDFL